MRRIGVLSDSHGNVSALSGVLYKMELMGKIDALLFLGDGARDLDPYMTAYPEVLRVRGNCDGFSCQEPLERILSYDGVNILMTHGHEYRVKTDTYYLSDHAHDAGAQVALFGHTHSPVCFWQNNVLLINPGACWDGRGGVLLCDKGMARFERIG